MIFLRPMLTGAQAVLTKYRAAARTPASASSNLRLVALALGVIALCLAAASRAAEARLDPATQADVSQAVLAGSLIRYEALPNPPEHSRAFRFLYRSTDPQDRPIIVSAIAVIPTAPAPPGGRPVVAWAHPTTGVVSPCAPSLSPLRLAMIPGLHDMLGRGFVVTASDYPGLGTGGVHPFLVGDSEARAVLDSVRAARALPDASASTRFALWGHSQGGQAVLFAGAIARAYAPELQLAGVAAAAPATDLAALFRDDLGSNGGNNLTALTLWSWSQIFGASYEGVVAPGAGPAIVTIAHRCIDALLPSREKQAADRVLAASFLTVPDLTVVEPWAEIIRRNLPGPLPAGVPLFLSQGSADVIVRPEITRAYARRQCAAGGSVTFDTLSGVGHGWAAFKSARAAIDWMQTRFAGDPASHGCEPG